MTILLLLSYVFAGTCELSNAKDGQVDVYFQRLQTSGTIPAKSFSSEITLSAFVDPNDIKVKNFKAYRPRETAPASEAILVDAEIIGNLSFKITRQDGRIKGEPVVSFDPNTRIATVAATLKYKDGNFDSHKVSITGRIVNSFQQPITHLYY